MPMYEYQCATCGKVFELIQRFSDAPLVVHEGCGGPLERLVSAPALQFKGSGWYVTDYAKGGSKPAGESTKSEAKETKTESKSESKGESKSETKTESKPAATTTKTGE